MTKTCSKCGTEKSVEDFYVYRRRGKVAGRQSHCKDCVKASVKAYQEAHPRDPAKERERLRAFRRANPDKDREYGQRWREKNGERALALARERGRKWRREKPERKIASQARRRYSLILTEKDTEYIAILRNDPCSYCGGAAGAADHIEPLFHGGAPGWENMTGACRSCNASKCVESLLAFLHRTAQEQSA